LFSSTLIRVKNISLVGQSLLGQRTPTHSKSTILVEGNTGDRNDLYLWHGGDTLIQAVAAVNPNTIVVVHAVGPVDVEAWVENKNGQDAINCIEVCSSLFLVTAIVWAGLPGQESGWYFL
jgi:Glycosyl hydrolase family 3 C-terminal domain